MLSSLKISISPPRLAKGAIIRRHATRKRSILLLVEGGVDKLGDETHGGNNVQAEEVVS